MNSPNRCFLSVRQNSVTCSKKAIVLTAVMTTSLCLLIYHLLRLSEAYSDSNNLMPSMAEPIKREGAFFPFDLYNQHLWQNGSSACHKGYFFCNSSIVCIEISKRCDGKVDCPNAEDELNCLCAFRLPTSKLCDKYIDCFDGSDENFCSYCPPKSYNCGNGKCISHRNVCDNIAQCGNAMDESFCFQLASTSPNTFNKRTVALLKTGFLWRNKRGEWYPVCAHHHDPLQDVLVSHACVSITGNPLASTTYQRRRFSGEFLETSRNFIHHFYSRFVRWDECRSEQGLFLTCEEEHCGLSPHYLISGSTRARIVGGNSSDPGAWPWHAAVYKNGSYACGATLINNRWLLSASHCFLNYENNYYEVQLGMLRRHSFSPYQQIYKIDRVITHNQFHIITLEFDIALIRTSEPVTFGAWVRPICLPEFGQFESAGSYCTTIGWGDKGEAEGDSDDLQEVHIPLASSCRNAERWICAGYPEGGKDACQGDSGGPLMCRRKDGFSWYIAGVISAGTGCARPGAPGMYTRIAHFLNWISDTVNIANDNVHPPLSSCPGWSCRTLGGSNCLVPEKLCDGNVDCLDAQDEISCVAGKKKIRA